MLADRSTWAEPDAGLEDTIVRTIAGTGPDADRHPAPPVITSVPRLERDDRRAPWYRRRAVTALVAAAAAIALVVGVTVATRDRDHAAFKARLTATGLAPGARAAVEIYRTDAGFRVTLDAKGLPLLSGREFYQAWLKSASGTTVPVGSFSSSAGRVTLWSGVSPKDYPNLTVTIEAADNVQSPSGRRVLAGEVTPA